MQDRIKQIQDEYLEKISQTKTLNEVDDIFLELFGKNGQITLLPKDFTSLDKDQLQQVGPAFNTAKNSLETAIEQQRSQIKEKLYSALNEETFDVEPKTQIQKRQGHLHPLTQFEDEIVELFGKIGFQLYLAPHIDSDYYNFELLNIPKEHPARDLWDTFYIEPSAFSSQLSDKKNKLLLRTHTSNAQIRIMNEFKAPTRMMVLDRCFRYENLDARHEHTFDQFELVYIDKGLSMANLQYLSEYFLKSVLGQDIEVRMRPKYYPFVEPGVGIDGKCPFCKGKGCKICGEVGWLELGGAGMIHPTVLRNGGIDPDVYSGIAWGPGLERILMLKHNLNDLRLFRNGDLRFLEKF